MSAYTLKFLPRVREQIEEAIARTREEYGDAKALEYGQLIRRSLHDLAENPFVRQLRPDIHPDARVMHIRRPGQDAAHLFLYRIRGEVVEIGRFRSDRTDLQAQVPPQWKRQ